jgi:hypothetical protein
MGARFLLTGYDGPKDDPADAARMARTTRANRDLIEANREVENETDQDLIQNRTIWLPDDCVLLMIGITDELVEACREAEEDASKIASGDQRSIQQRWYVRVKASRTRTDTLVAIATRQYWKTSRPITSWKKLIGCNDYFCNLVDGRGPDVDRDTYSLPEMIRDCKGEKAWIDP